MALVKAVLRNVSVSPPDPPEGIPVQFNPTEYSITRSVSYADIAVPGLSQPLMQFVRGETQTLSLELFLDGTDDRLGVEDWLEALRSFVTIDPELHAPPVCEFSWGDVTFQGVVTTLNERFQLFDEAGVVTRARVGLTLKSYIPADVQYRELNRQSPDRTKARVVRAGDRLDLLADQAYQNPASWRVIARHNDIARPRHLPLGAVLEIPPL